MNIEFTVSVQYLIKSDKWLWEVQSMLIHTLISEPISICILCEMFNYTKKYAYYTYFFALSKPRIMKLVFAASLMCTQHKGVRADTGWLGLGINVSK